MHTNKQELKIQTQSNKRILICMRGSSATFKRQAALNMFSIYVLAVCSATWHQELCRQEGEWPVTVLLPASFSWQKAPRTQKKWSIISLSLIWFQVHKRCWKKLLLNVGKKKKKTLNTFATKLAELIFFLTTVIQLVQYHCEWAL